MSIFSAAPSIGDALCHDKSHLMELHHRSIDRLFFCLAELIEELASR